MRVVVHRAPLVTGELEAGQIDIPVMSTSRPRGAAASQSFSWR
jgi:hypothetical protein